MVVVELDVDEVVVVVGHGSLVVRNTMSQPPYGHSALHGCRRDAVGTAAGQPHGFWIVVTNRQSPASQSLLQLGLMSCLVTVGQAVSARSSAKARPTATAASARNFMLISRDALSSVIFGLGLPTYYQRLTRALTSQWSGC